MKVSERIYQEEYKKTRDKAERERLAVQEGAASLIEDATGYASYQGELAYDQLIDGGILFEGADREQLLTAIDTAIRDLRALRRALNAPVRTCEACGRRFAGRSDARYHNDACRQRAHRSRVTANAGV